MNWLNRLFNRSAPQIPDPLWEECMARLPFLQRLPAQDESRLKALCETFLDRKSFTAAGGLELTDEIAVAIACQACLPVLNLTLDLYRDMAGVILYPSAFLVPMAEVDDAGVVHEWREPLSGEAIDAGGAVALSWEDVENPEMPGHNVVIHEFVHKIDMSNGSANGFPPLLPEYHARISPNDWKQAFTAAYEDFLRRVDDLETRLPEDFDDDNPLHAGHYDELAADLPLDPYAAKHPAEFFAVASEAFFVWPEPLAAAYPEVYQILSNYFGQDPLRAETGG